MGAADLQQIGVLISGRGTNLLALQRAIDAGRLRARIAVVISNVAEAPGLAIARDAGIETLTMRHQDYAGTTQYDEALVAALAARGVSLVCLAGFMRVLGTAFCGAFPHAALNIHPSLLPAFSGARAVRQALAHGVRLSGATVHFVTATLDAGPIVAQQAVPVLDTDTEDTLAARILDVEHEIYPAAVARVLSGRWRVVDRRVVFDDEAEALR